MLSIHIFSCKINLLDLAIDGGQFMEYINNLRNLRMERGYTQVDIAEILQTTQQQYSCSENGKNELPIRHLIKLCEFYQVSSDYILGIHLKK